MRKAWQPPEVLNLENWKYQTWLTFCKVIRVYITLSRKDVSAESLKWWSRSGIQTPCSTLPTHPPLFNPTLILPALSILNHHPLFPSPSISSLQPPHHHHHQWLGTMASVSLLGAQIKGKLQPTSMQNVIWKACSHVLTIDFSLFSNLFPLTRFLSPRSSSPFLSKHNNMQCEIWRRKSPNSLRAKKKKKELKREKKCAGMEFGWP